VKLPLARSSQSGYHVGPVLALKADAKPAEKDKPDAKAPTTADVYVFDGIGGYFGVTAADFVKDVAGLDVDELVLHLNSPGGVASEGVAIANVLRSHKAKVTVRVDGMAASAASVIAMAGDEVIMGVGSMLMIHDPWSMALGNAADLDKEKRALDAIGDALASTYAAKAGGTAADWREVMRAEAWYTAEEAVAAGLADRAAPADEVATAKGDQVTPGTRISDMWDAWDSLASPDRFDLSGFAYAGRAAAPAPPMPARTTPAADAARTDEGKDWTVAFSDDQLSTLRQHLGLADDADEQAIMDAVTAPAPEPEPAAAALPEGTVAIDAAALADLQTAAAMGREARARQAREDRESLVDAAIRDGRVPPARRAAWVAQLEADPGAEAVLASLAPGLIPVAEIGHAGEHGDPEADALYASIFGKDGA
jgi:ATP-dependent protease ClpP protease subunit